MHAASCSVSSQSREALVRTLGNGSLLCIICNVQVGPVFLLYHSNGRKHRENVISFKKAATASATLMKRNSNESTTSLSTAPLKKMKVVKEPTSKDFNESTPWEKDSTSKIIGSNTTYNQTKNIIEGVPEGFFEDEKLNSRVIDTIEKQANIEQQYADFIRELDDAKHEEEHREENEEHIVAVEHDIELIDEQIDQWKRVNRLELRRDKLYSTVAEKSGRNTEPIMGQMSDDDSDIDLTGWRNKGI
ncbi:MGC20398 protein, putative [Brugia malayi]|uniref:MGC20398 protein, putative n=2 Tax=Brugia malayi TaxID=6279 RepID=A0A4E9F561_BRUMA|nr:MGC20398 protein, putative [Brugia malayi]VIO91429.1 MGC20398 protein, putative [Brugia malayi]